MAELIKIQFLRGTKAQIISASNDAGKPFWSTDTNEVYMSDGTTKHFVGKVDADAVANRPTASTIITGKLFYATDEDRLYRCTGVGWDIIGTLNLSELSGDLDDISDGTTYGKVKNTELSNGQVAQVRATTSNMDVTGESLYTHINDGTVHFVINDSSISGSTAYSSQKIEDALDEVRNSMIRQPKVIDRTATPPVSPTTGDRYLIAPSATGDWASHDNEITTYNGTSWDFTIADEGWVVYNDTSNSDWIAVDDGALVWEERNATITNHNDLAGLNVGDYQHLTAAEYTAATTVATTSTNGLMSAADKTKLDGIEAGAEVNQTITTGVGVTGADAGSSGDVTIDVDFEDANANIEAVLKGPGDGIAGTSDKVARADHQHRLVDVNAGTL